MYFLSGLPRSGSTVLTKLLNQNPHVYASNTSALIDFVIPASGHLRTLKQQHSSGAQLNIRQILSTSATAFHDTQKPHVIDKNRGWVINWQAVDQELQPDPLMIVTFRPIEYVVSSFYKLLNHVNASRESPEQIFLARIKDIYVQLLEQSHLRHKLCVITYDQIVNDSQNTLIRIEDYLGLPHHNYDVNNISDVNPENDDQWGIKDLHKVRPNLTDQSLDPTSIMTTTELNFCKQLTQELYQAYEIPTS